MGRIFATADVGSNTAHILVAETDGKAVERLENVSEWISLGEAVTRTGIVSAERIEEISRVMSQFADIARKRKAEGLYVFATEAMRLARNHEAVVQRILKDTGIQVEIISPQREVELSLDGIVLNGNGRKADLILEVGGGSAQVATVNGGGLKRHLSLPIGTGRLVALTGLASPTTPDKLLAAERMVADALQTISVAMPKNPHVVASGGVARGFVRALHPDLEKWIHREEIEFTIWATSRLTPEKIAERFRVKIRRAQTLLPGALVYRALMERLGIAEMYVSDYGVREGAILGLARGKIKACPV